MTLGCKQSTADGFFSNLASLSKAKQTLEIGTYCSSQLDNEKYLWYKIFCTFEISIVSILIRKERLEQKKKNCCLMFLIKVAFAKKYI